MLCSYSVSLFGSDINGTRRMDERGLFVGIIGRFEGGKEAGSRFERTYSWEEIEEGEIR